MSVPCALIAQTDSSSYLSAGNQAFAAKDYLVALLNFQAAVQTDPNNAAAHQCLGSVYYVQGQKEKAWAEFQASLRLKPNNPALASFVQSLTPPASVPKPPVEGTDLGTPTPLPTPITSPSILALPSMPHLLTPVPELGRASYPSPNSQVESNALVTSTAPIVPETDLPPLPEPGVTAQVSSSSSPITVSSVPEVSPTATPAAGNGTMPDPHSKRELDVAVGGLVSLNGGQGLGWGGSIAYYDPVSPGLGLGGSLGFYAMNSQILSDNTFTTVPPSTPSTSPGQEVLNQTYSRFQILGSAKFTVTGLGLRPYLLAGLGLAFLSDSGTDSEIVSGNTLAYHTLPDNTQTCVVGETGLGLKIPLAQALDLFLEGKVDLLLGLNGGTTTAYFPFQAGLGFIL